MSGLELSKILKNDPNTVGIFVIMLTAKAETADRIPGLKLGADDYSSNPSARARLCCERTEYCVAVDETKVRPSLQLGHSPWTNLATMLK